jgi:hypothetical protein
MEITQLNKIFLEDYRPTEKELDEIRKWSEDFPYMQTLHWVLAKFDQGPHPQKAILYKTDPLLFAEWFDTSAQAVSELPLPQVLTEKLESKPEIEVAALDEMNAVIGQTAEPQHLPEDNDNPIQDEMQVELIMAEELKSPEDSNTQASQEEPMDLAVKKQESTEFSEETQTDTKETASKPEDENGQNEEDILALIHDLPNAIPLAGDLEGIMPKTEEPEAEEIQATVEADQEDEDRSLMVMMSFQDWLKYFKNKKEKDREEEEGRRALRTAWQKEKLTAAIEEETDDIPEPIFKQAMESISNETGVISESLALVLAKQGKTDKAIEMYRKLSLRNPEKSAYFAALIQNLRIKQ